MRATVYLIDTPAPGRLATMARPRGGDWLADEMAGLREAGVDTLVSALRDDECELLDLVDEPNVARAAGLVFVSIPVVDTGVPDRTMDVEVATLADRLAAEVLAGQFVVTHCRAGIGRSSILAGTVLVRLGLTAGMAWQRIRAARGLPVPDNAAQEAWLHAFADGSHSRSAGS
jgi:protein-tyrosine phosphatase